MIDLKYKYQQLADDLIGRIDRGEYIRGGKLPSERNLSSDYGVSRDCVRMVLETLEGKGRIFRVNGKGAFVGNKYDLAPEDRPSSQIIALTTLSLPNLAPAAQAALGASSVLSKGGYHLISEWLPDDPKIEREVIDSLLNRGVDGLVLTATTSTRDGRVIDNREYYEQLSRNKVPFVVFDRFITGNGWSTVGYQVKEPTLEALGRIVGGGCKRIAY